MAMPVLLSNVPIGFRFKPTDQELVVDYLQRRAAGQPCPLPIANIEIHNLNPYNLPSMPLFGGHEWYFFTMKDHRKYSKRSRPNRSAATGFWKVNGRGELISLQQNHGDVIVDLQPIAIKKVHVFHIGCPPTERKTPWMMHTYSLIGPIPLDGTIEWVLCKIFRDTKMILPPPPPPGPGPAEISDVNGSGSSAEEMKLGAAARDGGIKSQRGERSQEPEMRKKRHTNKPRRRWTTACGLAAASGSCSDMLRAKRTEPERPVDESLTSLAEIQQLQDSMHNMTISDASDIVMYPNVSFAISKQAPYNYQELYHHQHHQIQINDDGVDNEAISEVITSDGGPMSTANAMMANSAASTSGGTTAATNHHEEDGAIESEPQVIDKMLMGKSSFADLE
ncbi:NAC domain-containing protein 41 [Brachypodium distachyon]|uniref:NAC domain-containing protein 41 n=1 Tax=Brachypodium distachyon TaxID=15368 RepID=UPI000D0CD28B|nr:NAC domain-containing protein 41 [Brachypodium distachyon]|eukprot:XP_024314606.1 NAC domain-containing protein 41 [Brachypodium distachyon]